MQLQRRHEQALRRRLSAVKKCARTWQTARAPREPRSRLGSRLVSHGGDRAQPAAGRLRELPVRDLRARPGRPDAGAADRRTGAGRARARALEPGGLRLRRGRSGQRADDARQPARVRALGDRAADAARRLRARPGHDRARHGDARAGAARAGRRAVDRPSRSRAGGRPRRRRPGAARDPQHRRLEHARGRGRGDRRRGAAGISCTGRGTGISPRASWAARRTPATKRWW